MSYILEGKWTASEGMSRIQMVAQCSITVYLFLQWDSLQSIDQFDCIDI